VRKQNRSFSSTIRQKKRNLSADDADEFPERQKTFFGLNLFWRTFFMLSLLLISSLVVVLQTARALHFEPLTRQMAMQITSLVNLSRLALTHSDTKTRHILINKIAVRENFLLLPRNDKDQLEPLHPPYPLGQQLGTEIARYLGENTVVAGRVNGAEGVWISFSLDNHHWWLRMDHSRLMAHRNKTWLIWLCTAIVVSLGGAAAIARFLNKPLKQLSDAAKRVRGGDFNNSRLDESVVTNEIRSVNMGFNSMAQKLEKMEQDRAIMLAGISHDLRTPLARLRLETEMSVEDAIARNHMVADIVQLDAIIDKFLEYARPNINQHCEPVNLHNVVSACIYAMQNTREMLISLQIPKELTVMADEVELSRVISNLLENARRYGKDVGRSVTRIHIAARARNKVVQLRLRDHGPGVPPDQLTNLIKPFFRSDSARTAATGAGLGLSIADKIVQRMGGVFTLTNSSSGGLVAHIQLPRAPECPLGQTPQPRLHRPQIKRQSAPLQHNAPAV